MDFGFRKTNIAQEASGIEIADFSGESITFNSPEERVSKLLRRARENNPANALPDKLCSAGAVVFAALAVSSLLIWGVMFRNATMLLTTWALLSLLVAIPVLTLEYIRKTLGLASNFHKFHSRALTLTPDRIIIEMRRSKILRGKNSPSVRRELLYSRIERIEYDRASKTLRLISAHSSLDIAMFYDNSDKIISEIEKRSGIFTHPAMRADDYADLITLPGFKTDRKLFRPFCTCVLAFCLVSLVAVIFIRAYNHNNPYTPFPQTEEHYLAGSFGIGDVVTLDGCEITLTSISRVGSDARGVCYQFALTLNNNNSSAIRLHDENFIFTARTYDNEIITLETSGPPLGHVGVSLPKPQRLAGEAAQLITFFVWAPDEAEEVFLGINSDLWPIFDVMRDVRYTGGLVALDGAMVKSNQVQFVVERTYMD